MDAGKPIAQVIGGQAEVAGHQNSGLMKNIGMILPAIALTVMAGAVQEKQPLAAGQSVKAALGDHIEIAARTGSKLAAIIPAITAAAIVDTIQTAGPSVTEVKPVPQKPTM